MKLVRTNLSIPLYPRIIQFPDSIRKINTEKNNIPLTTKYISEASLYSVCVKQKEYNPRERGSSTIYSKYRCFLENNYRGFTVIDFQILGHHYYKIHPRFNKSFQRGKETLLRTCQFKMHSNWRNAEIWKSIHLRMNENNHGDSIL